MFPLYYKELESREEMKKFLYIYDLLQLNQKTNILKRSIAALV